MRRGAEVIYQGTLLVDGRLGLPDFLIRTDLLGSPIGPEPQYEVVDAKLARSAKARAVLQTTFYSELLGEPQGHMPEKMHLALGNQDLLPLRVADYAAYTRQVRHSSRLRRRRRAVPTDGYLPRTRRALCNLPMARCVPTADGAMMTISH